jgi:hypothetical protein
VSKTLGSPNIPGYQPQATQRHQAGGGVRSPAMTFTCTVHPRQYGRVTSAGDIRTALPAVLVSRVGHQQ